MPYNSEPPNVDYLKMIEEKKNRLKNILLKKSVKFGTFTLTSGKTSDFYVDVRQTALSAEGATLIGELLLHEIVTTPHDFPKDSISGVAGLTLGADPIVTAISIASHHSGYRLPALIVRKESKGHGTNNFIEGLSNIGRSDARIVVVDDVITTGGSILKTIQRIEDQGFVVPYVLSVIDRSEGGKEVIEEKGYPVRSLFVKNDLIPK